MFSLDFSSWCYISCDMVRHATSWLVVDPWELTRRRAMDYLSILEHVKEVYRDTFPDSADDITILYMCPASQVIIERRCSSMPYHTIIKWVLYYVVICQMCYISSTHALLIHATGALS